MLALPTATAPLGPLPSSLVLLTVWAALLAEAMLIAEVNISVTEQRSDDTRRVTTLRQMADATLGPVASNAVTAIYLALAYGLLMAYIGKAGDALHHLSLGTISSDAGMLLAVGAVALLLTAGGAAAADTVNRALTAILLILFLVIMLLAAPLVDPPSLANLPTDWSAAPSALPIVFLTLVYHDLIPVLCLLLGFDRRAVQTALVAGSILPLLMFTSWNTLVLGVAAGDVLGDPLDMLVGGYGGLGMAVQAFSLLAVLTSFIGISLGITETAKTELPLLVQVEEVDTDVDSPLPTLALYAATLAPAALAASTHPASFVDILQACGAYGMVLLYGVLPPLMVLNVPSRSDPSFKAPARPQLAPLVAVLVSFSVLVGGTHAVQDARRLSSKLSLSQLEALVGGDAAGQPEMVLVRGDGGRGAKDYGGVA